MVVSHATVRTALFQHHKVNHLTCGYRICLPSYHLQSKTFGAHSIDKKRLIAAGVSKFAFKRSHIPGVFLLPIKKGNHKLDVPNIHVNSE